MCAFVSVWISNYCIFGEWLWLRFLFSRHRSAMRACVCCTHAYMNMYGSVCVCGIECRAKLFTELTVYRRTHYTLGAWWLCNINNLRALNTPAMALALALCIGGSRRSEEKTPKVCCTFSHVRMYGWAKV